MSWSDRYTRAQLAAELDAIVDRAPVLSLAAMALRNGETSDALADALDDHAHLIALRWGNYEGHGVCSDAAEALRPVELPGVRLSFAPRDPSWPTADEELNDEDAEPAMSTGTFHALRSSVIAGVAVTEYEADDTRERYVLAGLGHPEQPPELVRVYETDPDEAYEDFRNDNDA